VRIGWLVRHIFQKTIGGVERHIDAHSRWMRSWGHEVELWSSEYPKGCREELPDGRKIFGLGLRPVPSSLWRIAPLCRVIDAVQRLPDRFDAVFSADHLLTASWALRNSGVPIIYCPGGTVIGTTQWHFPVLRDDGWLRSFLQPARQYLLAEKICLQRVAGIAPVSEAVKRQMLSVHPGCAGRMRVIHLGYEPDDLLPRHPSPVFTVVCVARLHPIKNIDFLIRAWRQVTFSPKRLVLVGDGEERIKLQTLSAELGLGGSVEFAGERHDVPRWLAGSDVFILPSRYEACPLAVLEAMGTGLPCLTLRSVAGISDVAASGELNVEGETGLFADPEDPRDLAEQITYLADHPEVRDRMGWASRHRALTHFTWEQAARKYMQFAEDLIQGRRIRIA